MFCNKNKCLVVLKTLSISDTSYDTSYDLVNIIYKIFNNPDSKKIKCMKVMQNIIMLSSQRFVINQICYKEQAMQRQSLKYEIGNILFV